MKIVEKTVLTSKTKHNQNTHKSNKYNHSRARTTEKNQIRSVPNTHSCAGPQTRWHKVRSRIRLSPGSYQTFSVPPYLSRCFLSHPSALLLVFGLVLIGFQIHFWELLWDRGNLDELYVSSRSGETPPPLLLLLLLTLFFFLLVQLLLLVLSMLHFTPCLLWSSLFPQLKCEVWRPESLTMRVRLWKPLGWFEEWPKSKLWLRDPDIWEWDL